MANFYLLGAFLLAFIVGEAAAGGCGERPAGCGECPAEWKAFRDYCYKLSCKKDTYMQAKADCAAMGAQMTAPHDEEEVDFVLGISTYLWIGCDDIEIEGNFNCCDGTPITYTNWKDGEPNDHQANGGEDCATLISTKEYNDINCAWREAKALCKKHVSAFV